MRRLHIRIQLPDEVPENLRLAYKPANAGWMIPVEEEASVAELAARVTESYRRRYPDFASRETDLSIDEIQDGYGCSLEISDLVGDVFLSREATPDPKNYTVHVVRRTLTPAEIEVIRARNSMDNAQMSGKEGLLAPESSVRIPKRLLDSSSTRLSGSERLSMPRLGHPFKRQKLAHDTYATPDGQILVPRQAMVHETYYASPFTQPLASLEQDDWRRARQVPIYQTYTPMRDDSASEARDVGDTSNHDFISAPQSPKGPSPVQSGAAPPLTNGKEAGQAANVNGSVPQGDSKAAQAEAAKVEGDGGKAPAQKRRSKANKSDAAMNQDDEATVESNKSPPAKKQPAKSKKQDAAVDHDDAAEPVGKPARKKPGPKPGSKRKKAEPTEAPDEALKDVHQSPQLESRNGDVADDPTAPHPPSEAPHADGAKDNKFKSKGVAEFLAQRKAENEASAAEQEAPKDEASQAATAPPKPAVSPTLPPTKPDAEPPTKRKQNPKSPKEDAEDDVAVQDKKPRKQRKSELVGGKTAADDTLAKEKKPKNQRKSKADKDAKAQAVGDEDAKERDESEAADDGTATAVKGEKPKKSRPKKTDTPAKTKAKDDEVVTDDKQSNAPNGDAGSSETIVQLPSKSKPKAGTKSPQNGEDEDDSNDESKADDPSKKVSPSATRNKGTWKPGGPGRPPKSAVDAGYETKSKAKKFKAEKTDEAKASEDQPTENNEATMEAPARESETTTSKKPTPKPKSASQQANGTTAENDSKERTEDAIPWISSKEDAIAAARRLSSTSYSSDPATSLKKVTPAKEKPNHKAEKPEKDVEEAEKHAKSEKSDKAGKNEKKSKKQDEADKASNDVAPKQTLVTPSAAAHSAPAKTETATAKGKPKADREDTSSDTSSPSNSTTKPSSSSGSSGSSTSSDDDDSTPAPAPNAKMGSKATIQGKSKAAPATAPAKSASTAPAAKKKRSKEPVGTTFLTSSESSDTDSTDDDGPVNSSSQPAPSKPQPKTGSKASSQLATKTVKETPVKKRVTASKGQTISSSQTVMERPSFSKIKEEETKKKQPPYKNPVRSEPVKSAAAALLRKAEASDTDSDDSDSDSESNGDAGKADAKKPGRLSQIKNAIWGSQG